MRWNERVCRAVSCLPERALVWVCTRVVRAAAQLISGGSGVLAGLVSDRLSSGL
jgi:hypothetical protein